MADALLTTNYNLQKVVLADKYGVDTYNQNLDKIDNALTTVAGNKATTGTFNEIVVGNTVLTEEKLKALLAFLEYSTVGQAIVGDAVVD